MGCPILLSVTFCGLQCFSLVLKIDPATSASCRYSFDLWAADAEHEEFKKVTGYRAHSFFGVNPGSGHGIEALPDWVKPEPTWDIDRDVLGVRNAMVYVFPRNMLGLGSDVGGLTATRQASATGSQLSALRWA